MVEDTNLEEYADPEIYDYENRDFEPDGPFYLTLAQEVGGSVLELGCGTGRVAIPLARHGIDVTGLDISPGMLHLARRKAGDVPIQWAEADVRHFRIPSTFRLISMPSGSFHHMLNRADQDALLARVLEHLQPNGVFVFDLRIPKPNILIDREVEEPWYTYTDPHGREIRLSGTSRYDPSLQILHETAYRRWTEDGQDVVRRARLALKFVFPEELKELLDDNGIRIMERYGDWDRSALTPDSATMILVCTRR